MRDGGGVLLITDVDALLPATAEPVAALILAELRTAVATDGVALIATSARPDQLDPRLRAPDCATVSWACRCPTPAPARRCWRRCSSRCPPPTSDLDEIAGRTPGFVVADLAALLREAALRAASRASADGQPPTAEPGRSASAR